MSTFELSQSNDTPPQLTVNMFIIAVH